MATNTCAEQKPVLSQSKGSIQPVSTQALDIYTQDTIQSRILTIRGVQVILDRDLAILYQVETKRINEAVKRNPLRFPEDFYFQLTTEELESLKSHFATSNTDTISSTYEGKDSSRSQNSTLKNGRGHNIKYLPYAFTEEGVGQLSAVLKSETAAVVSVRIQRAFVAMRKYISANAGLFQRIESLEAYRLETKQEFKAIGERFDQIMDRLDDGSLKQKLGIFFDGQMFDAFVLIEELIQKASRRIVLIDDYLTASVLQRFHHRNPGVTLDCYVKTRFATDDLQDAIRQYNAQYPTEPTVLHTFERSHDRWLIIDETVYHFGASLKDLGKRWFSVDIITEHTADDLISRL